eukprot:g74087.t1
MSREFPSVCQQSSVQSVLSPLVWENGSHSKKSALLGFLRGINIHDREDNNTETSQKTSWNVDTSRYSSPTVMFHDYDGFAKPNGLSQTKKSAPTLLGFLRGINIHDREDNNTETSQKASFNVDTSRYSSPTVMFHDYDGFAKPAFKYSPNGLSQTNHDVEGTTSDSSDVPSPRSLSSQIGETVKPENDHDGSTSDDHGNSPSNQVISQDQENESAPAEKRRKRRSEARRKRRQNRRRLWTQFFQKQAELQRQAAAGVYYYDSPVNASGLSAANMLPPGAYIPQQRTHLQMKLQLERQIQYLQQQLAQAQQWQHQAPYAPPANVQNTQQVKRQWGLPPLVIEESDKERRNVAPRLPSPILLQQRVEREMAALSQSMGDLQLRRNREHNTFSSARRGNSCELPLDRWQHDTKIPPAARVAAAFQECSPANGPYAPQQKMYIPLRVVNMQD